MKILHPSAFSIVVRGTLTCCFRRAQVAAQLSSLAAPDESSPRSPKKEDGWLVERDEQTGGSIRTPELMLHPKAEPRPALQYRLIPDDFDMLDANAAVYYLKAAGFFEQNSARQKVNQFQREALDRAQREGKRSSEVPPWLWQYLPPDELPVDEVKEYLRLMEFQTPSLREARRRDRFDMDRKVREADDFLAYLLPELQSMRELARTQSVWCRLAIAEGRIDDAIEITGQQFALGRHLGQDEFLVSNLVGMAIASFAWNDALQLLQHPDTPNLYWAFAAMPTPLVDLRHSLAIERQLLYQQLTRALPTTQDARFRDQPKRHVPTKRSEDRSQRTEVRGQGLPGRLVRSFHGVPDVRNQRSGTSAVSVSWHPTSDRSRCIGRSIPHARLS
jgi:hypothetical protein